MSNISKNIIRTNFNLREVSSEVNKIKKMIQNAMKVEERFIVLTSIEGSNLHVNVDKIECIEDCIRKTYVETLNFLKYFGGKMPLIPDDNITLLLDTKNFIPSFIAHFKSI